MDRVIRYIINCLLGLCVISCYSGKHRTKDSTDYSNTISLLANGIVADGKTDLTTPIQELINRSSGKVIIWENTDQAYLTKLLRVPSDVTMSFEEGTEVRGADSIGGIFSMQDANNVYIKGNGSFFVQDRSTRRSMMYIKGGSNVILENLNLNGSGKDGIYVGPSTESAPPGKNHKIVNCRIKNMKRQGISVVHAVNTIIEKCHISNTHGMRPAAGIDLEENRNTHVENTLIKDCVFDGNREQAGVAIFKATKSRIENCIFKNNLYGINIDLPGTGVHLIPIEYMNPNTEVLKVSNHGLFKNDLVGFDFDQLEPRFVKHPKSVYRVYEVVDKDHIRLSTNYNNNLVDILENTEVQLKIYDLNELKDIVIDSCHFVNNKSHNIYAEQARDITVKDCSMHGGYGGINLVNVANVRIIKNSLYQNIGGRAILLTDRNAIIRDNVIKESKEDAIRIHGTECSVIENNEMINCNSDGKMVIFMKYTSNTLLKENIINNKELSVKYGIVFDRPNCFNNYVVGNKIDLPAYTREGRKSKHVLLGNASNFLYNVETRTPVLPCN